jgi:hypothetical protein
MTGRGRGGSRGGRGGERGGRGRGRGQNYTGTRTVAKSGLCAALGNTMCLIMDTGQPRIR